MKNKAWWGHQSKIMMFSFIKTPEIHAKTENLIFFYMQFDRI